MLYPVTSRKLVATGFAVGLDQLTNFRFKPDKPYTFCCICGDVYQTAKDRIASNPIDLAVCEQNRKAWSNSHARHHPIRKHMELKLSGNFCTPEAAQRLAALGVISVTDLTLSEEHEHAYAESSPIPKEDAQE